MIRLELCVYYGGRLIAPLSTTPFVPASPSTEWDVEVTTGILTSALPREAVLSCTLAQRSGAGPVLPIGWANLALFDYRGILSGGLVALPLWPCLKGDSHKGGGHPLGPHAPNRAPSEVAPPFSFWPFDIPLDGLMTWPMTWPMTWQAAVAYLRLPVYPLPVLHYACLPNSEEEGRRNDKVPSPLLLFGSASRQA